MANDNKTVQQDFEKLVTMTASQLKNWLDSKESDSVGMGKRTSGGKKTSAGGSESIGHESGRLIIKILEKQKADLTDEDYSQMARVNSYIKRHLAQQPVKENIKDSRWRYSLMNWGHDPLDKK